MDSPTLKISTLSLFLFLFLSSTQAQTSNLVDSVCKETLDYTKCLEALESDPKSKTTTDLKVLAKIAVQLSISNAKGSLSFIHDEIKKGTGGAQQEALEKCASSYETVVESFNSALIELDDDVLSANYDIKVAGDDVDSCKSELVSKKVEIPALSDRNDQVKLYSNIGFVITNKL
ncbi:pectinesterase inhibitor-like [Humulus lupulus]|uniref:pectinesterase inhibitor-like n=1 Tax=Humulus lupulus TaxID=3486 RepID=UPI002B408D98|nr:pectinesterase inhibitor-like [Humulus lupulus]